MGNQLKNFEKKKFNVIERINSRGLGNCEIVEFEGSSLPVLAIKSSKSIGKRADFSHSNLYKTLGVSKPIGSFIGQADSYIFFEAPKISLQNILDNRTVKKVNQDEVAQFALDISSGLSFLHQRKINHLNINTNTIFFDKETGRFKIYDHELVTGHDFCYKVARLEGRTPLFSPEQVLFFLDPKNKENLPVGEKSDVFSLGMVVLEMASLLPNSDIYDNKNKKIKIEELEKRLNSIKFSLNENLYYCLKSMLMINPEERISSESACRELKNIISEMNPLKNVYKFFNIFSLILFIF